MGLTYLRGMFSSKLLSSSCILLTAMLLGVSIYSLYKVPIDYDNLAYVAPNDPSRLGIERLRATFMKGYDGESLLMLAPVHTNTTVFGGPAVKDKTFWADAQAFAKDIYETSPEGSLVGSAFFAKADFFSPPQSVSVLELDACEAIPPKYRIGLLKMCNDLLYGWEKQVADDQSAAWIQIFANMVSDSDDSVRWTYEMRKKAADGVSQGKFSVAQMWNMAGMSLDVANGIFVDFQLFIPLTIALIATLFVLVFKSLCPAIVLIVDMLVIMGSASGITWIFYGSLPWALPPMLIVPLLAIPVSHDAAFFGRVHGVRDTRRGEKDELGHPADAFFSLHRFSLCGNLCKAAAFSGMMLTPSYIMRMMWSGIAAGMFTQQILVRGIVVPALIAAPTLLRQEWGTSRWWINQGGERKDSLVLPSAISIPYADGERHASTRTLEEPDAERTVSAMS